MLEHRLIRHERELEALVDFRVLEVDGEDGNLLVAREHYLLAAILGFDRVFG